jgi:hypothetical protein
MTRILIFLFGLTALLPSCGGKDGAAKEYDRLRNGELKGEELVRALEDFELRYPGHFYVKVDLGTYYLATGEEGRARDYLRRAEALTGQARRDLGSSPDGDENYLSIMYGALGQIYLNQGEQGRALEYAEKAIENAWGEGRAYRFLKGHILIARQEYAGALEVFEGLFAGPGRGSGEAGATGGAEPAALRGGGLPGDGLPEGSLPEGGLPEGEAGDILAYLFLLAQAGRSADAAAVLNRYFETGAFFPSLGTFAAMVYRSAGETERAAYAAYLEQEYRSGYGETEAEAPAGLPPAGNFFAGEYLAIKDEINRGSLSEDQFRRYIELEPYFRLFPSYYWNLWLGARRLYPEAVVNFAPALQKIISLDKDGPFAGAAWKELGALFGY